MYITLMENMLISCPPIVRHKKKISQYFNRSSCICHRGNFYLGRRWYFLFQESCRKRSFNFEFCIWSSLTPKFWHLMLIMNGYNKFWSTQYHIEGTDMIEFSRIYKVWGGSDFSWFENLQNFESMHFGRFQIKLFRIAIF